MNRELLGWLIADTQNSIHGDIHATAGVLG